MSNPENDKLYDDSFENRYRIEGELIALSPTHIGSGETRQDENNPAKKENESPPEISEIVRDFEEKPYLPGSALRGVVRHYLLQIFKPISLNIANDPNYETDKLPLLDSNLEYKLFKDLKQKEQIEYMKQNASLLEQLFGTPFTKSKIEFWDAPACNKISAPEFENRGWDEERQSYVVHSVAIDPKTGAAEKHKLYSFDVAPAGLRYEVNIVGQNLSEIELGFLFFGLEGFNSKVFPLTIGAMAGRGFGRMELRVKDIYCLEARDLEGWIGNTKSNDSAGYNAIPDDCKSEKLIQDFKDEFLKAIGGKV